MDLVAALSCEANLHFFDHHFLELFGGYQLHISLPEMQLFFEFAEYFFETQKKIR